MLTNLLEAAARKFKGPDYTIDRSVPLSALLGFAFRRLLAVVRSHLHTYGPIFGRPVVFIGRNVTLRNKSLIHMGGGVTLGDNVLIDGLSKEGVTIEDNVSIGPYTIIEATGVITSIGKGCSIGKNSGLGAFSFIGAAGGVSIGRDVIMGQRVSFHSENHHFENVDIPIRVQGVSRQGITIENNCWIGANVVFLDGAHVGSGCVIGAGAVVRGHIPANSIAVGIPARVVKNRKSSE